MCLGSSTVGQVFMFACLAVQLVSLSQLNVERSLFMVSHNAKRLHETANACHIPPW